MATHIHVIGGKYSFPGFIAIEQGDVGNVNETFPQDAAQEAGGIRLNGIREEALQNAQEQLAEV